MKESNRPSAWVEIDLKNLDHNFSIFKSIADPGKTKIMAVVKADAYGHGVMEISRRALANGAYALGIARVQEGQLLREKGIRCPIYILGEVADDDVDTALKHNLIPSISSLEKASVFDARAGTAGKTAKCHINIDTGMSRLGISYLQVPGVLKHLKKLSNLEVEGIFTHFACASDQESSFTQKQIERFKGAVRVAENLIGPIRFIHSANSAAFLSRLAVRMDMVRMGIAMYGLNPFSGECPVDLKPLLSLKAKVWFLKKVAKGETVSYCGTHRVQQESIIAALPVGYADGYSRLLSNKGKIIIGGQYAPVAGNITMDQFMADVTGIKGVGVGDVATLIGRDGSRSVTSDQLAAIMGTINYEVVCMIRSRLPRIFLT